MVIRSVRYDYTWGGENRAIAAFLLDTGVVECWRMSFPGGYLSDALGSYQWVDGALTGSGQLTTNQKTEIANLLNMSVEP